MKEEKQWRNYQDQNGNVFKFLFRKNKTSNI